MEQDSHDRLVTTLKPYIEPARLLIPKHFAHRFDEGENWEDRYPGVKVMTEFGGLRQMTELHLLGSVEPWHTAVSTKLDAVLSGAKTSMAVRDVNAEPPIYGGGIGEGYALTGGPELWDQFLLVVGLLKSGQLDMLVGMGMLDIDAPGVRDACDFAELSPHDYVALMMDMLHLFSLVKT